MLGRDELKEYAKRVCIPLMERTAARALKRELAFQADSNGYIPSFLENFCRPFWGISPLLADGEEILLSVEGKEVTVFQYMKEILLRGLSHGREESWDIYKQYLNPYSFENQCITELAGLAVGLYFAKEQLWEPFSEREKNTLAGELYQMAETAFDHSWPNNHYWFPLLTLTVLKKLGFVFDRTDTILEDGLAILDGLYMEDGWYQDGEFGRFDYYEAWSLHLYPLLWTLIADESFKGYCRRKEQYLSRTEQFLEFYCYWFDEKGAAVPFGRSLSYRFAACSLYPVAILAGCRFQPELAGRITTLNISYFAENYQSEESDILEEGYLYRSSNIVESYTSDGGAYWCCKSFLAFLLPKEHPFWNVEAVQIPAETGSFSVIPKHKKIHMVFEGNQGNVTLYNNTAQYYINGMMTHRFGNMRNWYSKFAYNSASGFGCSSCDNISIDNMIALVTPDMSMVSHRLGYVDLGYENGILKSRHIPFANDPLSVIDTWMIPMGTLHIRMHRVKISQAYYVREGGFSLSRWDDYCPQEINTDSIVIRNHDYRSVVRAAAEVSFSYKKIEVHPGYHLYAPLSAYPAYETTLLEPGEYFFAAVFALIRDGVDIELINPNEYLQRMKREF